VQRATFKKCRNLRIFRSEWWAPCCGATQSPMACIRWVRHGMDRLDASGGSRAQVGVRRLRHPGDARAHIGRSRFEQRSLLHHPLVRAEATVRCAGLQRAQVAPRQEMPNL
jgi:hypothetical protein